MTTTEKAKAYDKALEKAKRLYEQGTITESLAHIFPELKESEGEGIRKNIISFLRSKNGYMNPDEDWDFHNRWLPWLEKQDGQKSISDTRYEVKAGDSLSTVEGKPFDYEHATITQKDYAHRDYNDIDPHFGIPVENLMSKEKTAEKDEPKFHEGDWIIHHGTENIYQVVAIIDNQYQLKYGDNYTIQNCADVDRCARLWNIEKKELKKLTQSVTKTSEQVSWSEEDEYMLNETIQHLEELIRIDKAKHLGCDVQYYQRDIDWLKSLKERVQPQNTWKPSNEQMEVLLSEVTGWKKGCPKQIVLESLYNDLKKLK